MKSRDRWILCWKAVHGGWYDCHLYHNISTWTVGARWNLVSRMNSRQYIVAVFRIGENQIVRKLELQPVFLLEVPCTIEMVLDKMHVWNFLLPQEPKCKAQRIVDKLRECDEILKGQKGLFIPPLISERGSTVKVQSVWSLYQYTFVNTIKRFSWNSRNIGVHCNTKLNCGQKPNNNLKWENDSKTFLCYFSGFQVS